MENSCLWVMRCNENNSALLEPMSIAAYVWQSSKMVLLWAMNSIVRFHSCLRYANNTFAKVTKEMVSREAGYGERCLCMMSYYINT